MADSQGADVRYNLLEIVRQYAHERLKATGEAAPIQHRHAWFYLQLAEESEPALAGPDQVAWLARLALEHDNLRRALQWAGQTGAVEFGLRLAGALWRFWQIRGHVSEGREWLEELSAQAESAGAPIATSVRAKAYDGAGSLARIQGDYPRAIALCERALQLGRASGDDMGVAASLNSLGLISYQQADYARAAACYEESLAVYRDLRDGLGAANVLNNLGMVADDQGAYERAVSLYEASLEQFRGLGHGRNSATVLNNLGGMRLQLGEYAAALSLFEQSLAQFETLEDRGGMALVLEHLGEAAARQGHLDLATTYHRRSLALARDVGGRDLIAWNLHDLAAVAMMRAQQPDRAARDAPLEQPVPAGGRDRRQPARADWLLRAVHLFGAATGLRAALGAQLPPAEQPWYDQLIEEAHRLLGPDMFQRVWSAGEAWPVDEAIAYALSDRSG
jgi:tetratricopeptide (TPR) repeat protein